MRVLGFLPVIILISQIISACGSEMRPERLKIIVQKEASAEAPSANMGKTPSGFELYSQPIPGVESTFSCQTCHALSDTAAEDGYVRAGHEIGTAALRSEFKNGKAKTLRDATNVCLQDFMGATAWTEEDPKWIALKAFLEEKAQGKSGKNISFAIKAAPSPIPEGDANNGKAAFKKSCAICHGDNAEGGRRGPNLAGTRLSADAIADRVRSGPTKIKGARMPFFSDARLNDKDLIDIVTWLKTSTEKVATPGGTAQDLPMDPTLGLNFSVENAQANCAKTHPLVGAKGRLSQQAHAVSGTVEIIDDCTIAISDFTYDGNGIEVKVYTGKAGNYRGGKAISRDIYRPNKDFNKVKAFVRLPPGTSLDDFDGISIWCVAVGFSFGDVIFKK